MEKLKELFEEFKEIYNLDKTEVEDIFCNIISNYFDGANVILEDNEVIIDSIVYEYFKPNEISIFRNKLDEELNIYSLEKWKNYFFLYFNNNKSITGKLIKEGKKNYYFNPVIEEKINPILRIQVSKSNIRLNFLQEQGNLFNLYFGNKIKIFKKAKPVYFNKFFTPAKIITKQSVKEIIEKEIISVFSRVYDINDFKIRYISPVKQKYGIINLTIKKQISSNLLNYLNNSFQKYGYIVNIKQKKENDV